MTSITADSSPARRVRSHRLALAATTLAAMLAANVVSGTVDAASDDAAAADEAAGIAILDAGDQSDAVVLSLGWRAGAQAGTTLRNVEHTDFRGSVGIGSQTIEVSATTDLTDTREVLTADDSGTTVRVVVDSYTLTAADEISEQMAPAEHRGAIIGIPAIVSFDADGERIGAEFEDLAAPVAEQLLALDDVLEESDMLVLPATAVGTGARWTAPYGDSDSGELTMIAEFELVELTATSATLSFHVPDIASAFLNDVDLADARPGADSFIGGTVTLSRPGEPVHFEMTADARLQFSVDDTNTGLTYDYDLTTTRAASLTTV